MQLQKITLIIITLPGEYVETEYEDIEVARDTGKRWLEKGWARGFIIEK